MDLLFSDGLSIEKVQGPLRRERLIDGWYVVGQGMVIPVASKEEADQEIRAIQTAQEAQEGGNA